MVIIEKKVITEYHVEIDFTEFYEGFQNLVDDINSDRSVARLEARENMLAYAKKVAETNEGKVECSVAEDAYHMIMHPLTADIIRYLARQWGYNVTHFGMYYQHEHIYKCTFVRSGAHLEQ